VKLVILLALLGSAGAGVIADIGADVGTNLGLSRRGRAVDVKSAPELG